MRKTILTGTAATAFAAALAFAAPATAAVTFDPDSATGFVGKGDIQLAFNLNNNELQTKAGGVSFAAVTEKVTVVTWECTNLKNEKIQPRLETTTSTTAGVVSVVMRDNKKQVTGFKLTGFDQNASTTTSTTDGPEPDSCPDKWELTSPAGDPVDLPSISSLTATLGITTVTLQ